jgi:hypothetical protein
MSSPHTSGHGRHRGSSPRPTAQLSRLLRRPSHRSALKGLGLAASALGVATAFAAPATNGSFELTAADIQQETVVARAEAVSAPARVADYGVIGFTAKAVPAPKAKATAAAKDARTSTGVSRNTSRAGLTNVGGMTPNAIAVINAVKKQFPGVDGPFGGYRAGDPGDHGTGHAVDIMCSTAEGNEIASFLQANAATLNIKYLIWRQRIWYPGGGSWQGMADRGSPTANHYDHVHVSVFYDSPSSLPLRGGRARGQTSADHGFTSTGSGQPPRPDQVPSVRARGRPAHPGAGPRPPPPGSRR